MTMLVTLFILQSENVLEVAKRAKRSLADSFNTMVRRKVLMMMMMMMMIILLYQRGWDTCVPTPKMAYFSVFKAFFFLKYLKKNLGLIESSFSGVVTHAADDDDGGLGHMVGTHVSQPPKRTNLAFERA